jgi:hypothetical protein
MARRGKRRGSPEKFTSLNTVHLLLYNAPVCTLAYLNWEAKSQQRVRLIHSTAILDTHVLSVSPLLSVNLQIPCKSRLEEFLVRTIDVELLEVVALPIRSTVDNGFVVLQAAQINMPKNLWRSGY